LRLGFWQFRQTQCDDWKLHCAGRGPLARGSRMGQAVGWLVEGPPRWLSRRSLRQLNKLQSGLMPQAHWPHKQTGFKPQGMQTGGKPQALWPKKQTGIMPQEKQTAQALWPRLQSGKMPQTLWPKKQTGIMPQEKQTGVVPQALWPRLQSGKMPQALWPRFQTGFMLQA
jgi:hypothetical protein